MKIKRSSLIGRGGLRNTQHGRPSEIIITTVTDKRNNGDAKKLHRQKEAGGHDGRYTPPWKMASKQQVINSTKQAVLPRSTSSEVSSITLQSTRSNLDDDDDDGINNIRKRNALVPTSSSTKYSTSNNGRNRLPPTTRKDDGDNTRRYYSTYHDVMVNEARSLYGLPCLTRSIELDEIATDLVKNSAKMEYIGNINPFHYQGHVLRGVSTRQIHALALLEREKGRSHGPLYNILNPKYKEFGMATCMGQNGIIYLCHLFDTKTRAEI